MEDSIVFSVKLSPQIKKVIDTISKDLKLNKRYIVESALMDYIDNLQKKKFVVNGIDYKKYIKLKNLRLDREITLFYKREAKSKHLFIDRVKKDIFIYLIYNKTFEQINELLEEYKEIAKQYDDETPLKEIEEIIENGKKFQFQDIKEELGLKLKLEYRLEGKK